MSLVAQSAVEWIEGIRARDKKTHTQIEKEKEREMHRENNTNL